MRIHSDVLTVAGATKADVPELDELYKEACGFFKFEKPSPLHSPEECLSGGDLPENGSPENYELLTIRVNDMLIGYASVYRDFPAKTCVRLPLIYLGEPARGCGFGTKTAELLCRYFREAGYSAMRVPVSLRNWGALRFWNRLGFDRIISLDAQNDSRDGGYGGVELEKNFDEILPF